LTHGKNISRFTWNGATWTNEEIIYTAPATQPLSFTHVPHGTPGGIGYYNDTLQTIFAERFGGDSGWAWGSDGIVAVGATDRAKFYVTVPENLTEYDTYVYMYYDNDGVSTTSQQLDYTTGNDPTHGSWGVEEYPENIPYYYNTEIQADGDDDFWLRNDTGDAWTHYTSYLIVMNREYYADGYYAGQVRLQLDIPQGAYIESAILSFYETTDQGEKIYNIYRINEVNCSPDLESRGTAPAINYSVTNEFIANGVADEWQSADVSNLIQAQVNLPTWVYGYYFGMRFNDTQKIGGGNHLQFEDYQAAGTNHAYLNITWYYSESAPTWLDNFVYRKSHILEQTAGAGVDHTVPIDVYLSNGTDSGNTTYLDWESQVNMNDIRFTNSSGYELEFWRENFYYNTTLTPYFSDRGANFGWYSAGLPTSYYYNNRTVVGLEDSIIIRWSLQVTPLSVELT